MESRRNGHRPALGETRKTRWSTSGFTKATNGHKAAPSEMGQAKRRATIDSLAKRASAYLASRRQAAIDRRWMGHEPRSIRQKISDLPRNVKSALHEYKEEARYESKVPRGEKSRISKVDKLHDKTIKLIGKGLNLKVPKIGGVAKTLARGAKAGPLGLIASIPSSERQQPRRKPKPSTGSSTRTGAAEAKPKKKKPYTGGGRGGPKR
jgi:hypothetical protein